MANTQRLTVTLTTEQVVQLRALVAKGETASVSHFVQHAVNVALADDAVWSAELAQALASTGGDLTDEERAWVDAILNRAV